MNDFSNDKYAALLEKLEAGLSLSAKYRELTLGQKSSIDADDDTLLLSLLDERSVLIGEIDELNKSLEPEMAEYKVLYNPPDNRADELLAQSRILLEECAEIDKSNLESIRALMQKTATDGKNLSKRREGIAKYSQTDFFGQPEYLDERQ